MARPGHAAKDGRADARGAGARARPRGGAPADPARTSDPREDRSPLPALGPLLDPRGPYLIPILALLMARIVAWAETQIPAEDAYITFRYARNLVAGNGLVYNPGERVMGFTSPLWTVWIAAGYALFRDPLPWSRVWAIVADVATLVIVVRMLDRAVSRSAAWCFAVFFAAWPYFSASAVSGMESSLFLALIALSAALAARRDAWAGPALGALALVRPEGLACAAVLSLWAGWRSRIVALAVAVAGLAAIGIYYGSPVPESVLAKSRLYGVAGPWVGRHWWEWLSPLVLGRWPRQGDTALLVPLTIVLAPAFWVGARVLWQRRLTPVAGMAVACVVVWLGYTVLGVAYFWWYLLVPLAGVALVAAAGFPSIVRGRAIPVALLLMLVSIWSVGRELYVGRASQEGQSFGEASTRLRALAKPGDRVLLEPIGMIGYYAPVTVIDEIGLVTPRVAARRLQGPGWYTDVVAGERPEWLVVRAGVMRSGEVFAGTGAPFRNAAERQSVLERYEEVARTGADSGGDAALLILRRRP